MFVREELKAKRSARTLMRESSIAFTKANFPFLLHPRRCFEDVSRAIIGSEKSLHDEACRAVNHTLRVPSMNPKDVCLAQVHCSWGMARRLSLEKEAEEGEEEAEKAIEPPQ